MTYQTRIGRDGRLEATPDQLAAAGFTPGDLVTIEQNGRRPMHAPGEAGAALLRLREALRGYTVEQFLAERQADWSE